MNLRSVDSALRGATLLQYVGLPVRVTHENGIGDRMVDTDGLALSVSRPGFTARMSPLLILGRRGNRVGETVAISARSIHHIVELGPAANNMRLDAATAQAHAEAGRYVGGADGMPVFADATTRVQRASVGPCDAAGMAEFRAALVALAANCLARIVDHDEAMGR